MGLILFLAKLKLIFLLNIEETLSLTLINQDYGFDVSLNLLDIYVKVDTTVVEEISTPVEYVDLTGYVGIVEYLVGIINQESMRIAIDGSINIDDISVAMNGNIDLVLVDTYKINGELTVSIDDITLTVGIKLIGEDLYVTVLDKTIKVNLI